MSPLQRRSHQKGGPEWQCRDTHPLVAACLTEGASLERPSLRWQRPVRARCELPRWKEGSSREREDVCLKLLELTVASPQTYFCDHSIGIGGRRVCLIRLTRKPG